MSEFEVEIDGEMIETYLVKIDGEWIAAATLPPEQRSNALDGDFWGRIPSVDGGSVLHVRLRGGQSLCGRVVHLSWTPSKHRTERLCRWCERVMRCGGPS